jgi:hypothetical protein
LQKGMRGTSSHSGSAWRPSGVGGNVSEKWTESNLYVRSAEQ